MGAFFSDHDDSQNFAEAVGDFVDCFDGDDIFLVEDGVEEDVVDSWFVVRVVVVVVHF